MVSIDSGTLIVVSTLICTIIMGIVVYALSIVLGGSLFGIFVTILLGMLVYFFAAYVLAKERIKADILLIRQSIRK